MSSKYSIAIVLKSVLARWRRVAHGTPQLWERIYLGRGFSHRLHILIPLWLTNSRVTPLDIHASLQDWDFDCDHRLMERDLVRFLLPSICRCRRLVSSMSIVAIEFLFGRDLVMPYLEELEIWLPVWSSLVVPKLGNIQTPRLRSIRLNDTGFITNAFHSPLLSVQHLQLTGQETFGLLSHSRCLDFIALCPNLQTCTLTLSTDPGTPLRPPIILDSLCSLHLIFQFSPHDPIPFLRGLRTPHIERLTLQNHGGVSPVPHIRRVLNMLLSVRPHTIKELNLSSLFVPTSDWVPSLCELTELTSLSITGDSLDEYFFDVLAADVPLDPQTCPKLVSLKLHNVAGLLGLSGDRLVTFIRSRAPIHRDVPISVADDQKHLSHVSLILCDLENHHKDQLRDIERECNGALHLHGLDPSSPGTTLDLFNLIHPATQNFIDDLESL